AAAAYLIISFAAAAMMPAALAGMLGLAIRTRWKEAKRHSVVPRRCSFDCRGVAPDVVVGTLAVTQIGIASAPETSHPSRIVRRGSHRAHRAPGRVSYRSELLIAGTPKVTLLSFFCHAGNIPAPSEVRT